MAIEVTTFRKYEKNSLKGFVNLLFTGIGLQINDCPVHQKDKKRWINLPSRPYTKEDGSQGYNYIVNFPDKARYAYFQIQALKALDEYLSMDQAVEQPQIKETELPF
jgi:hypothetical protein